MHGEDAIRQVHMQMPYRVLVLVCRF